MGLPTIQLGTNVEMHLDPYDPVLYLITDDADELKNIAFRLKKDKPMSLRVFVYDYKYEDFIKSSAFAYLRGVCEALHLRFMITFKEAKRIDSHRRRRINEKEDVYSWDFFRHRFRAELKMLRQMPKFMPSRLIKNK